MMINPEKVSITIQDEIPPYFALSRILHVMREGKISEDSKGNRYYCWLTRWSDGICVATRRTRKGLYSFVVYRSKGVKT